MEEKAPYIVQTMYPPVLPSGEPASTANYVLKKDAEKSILDPREMPLWFKAYLEARYQSLMQEVNALMRQLGRNPKRCPHCGGELK